MRNKYMAVSVPIELIKIIDEKIKKAGYSSRAEFVKEACRRSLDQLGGETVGDEK